MARETILLAYDLIMKSYATRDMESTIYPSHQQAFESIYLQNQNTNRHIVTNNFQIEEPSGLHLTDLEVEYWNRRIASPNRYATCNSCAEMTQDMIQCHSLKKAVQVLTDEADLARSKMKEVSEEVIHLKSCLANIDKKIEDNCQKQTSRSRSPGKRSVVPLTEGTRKVHQSPAMRRRSSVLCENKLIPKVLTRKDKSSAIVLKSHEKREYPRTGLSTQQVNRSKIAVKSSENRIQSLSRATFVPEGTRRKESSTTTALTTRVGDTSNVFLLAPKAMKREISAVKVGKHTHRRPKHTSDVLKEDAHIDTIRSDERHISPMSNLAFEELFSLLDAHNHVSVTPSQVQRSIDRMKSKKTKAGVNGKTLLVRHPISRNPSTVSIVSRHTETSSNPKQAIIQRACTRLPATKVHFQKTLDAALQTRTKDTMDCEETEPNHFPSELENVKHADSETDILYGNTNTNMQKLDHRKTFGIDYRKRLCFKKRAPIIDVPNDNVQSFVMASEINKHSSNNCIVKKTSVSKVPDSCVVEECLGSSVLPTECEERPLWKYTCRSRNETRSILEQINKNTIEWGELLISANIAPNTEESAAHSIVTEKSLTCEIDDADTISDLDTVNSSCTIVAMSSDEETQRDIDCVSRHQSETSFTTSSRVEDIQVSETLPLAEEVTALEKFPLVESTDVSGMFTKVENSTAFETSPLVENTYASGTLTLDENKNAFETSPLVENTNTLETSPCVENTYASRMLTLIENINAFETSPLVENIYASGTLTLDEITNFFKTSPLVESTNAFETSSLVKDTKVSISLPLIEEIVEQESLQTVVDTTPLPCIKDEHVSGILHGVEDTKVSETVSCILDKKVSGRSVEQDTVTSRTTTDDKQDECPKNTGTPLTAESYHEELDRRVLKALESNNKRVAPAVQQFSLSYQKSSMKKRTLSCSKIAEERKTSTDHKTDAPEGKKTEGKIIYVKRPLKSARVHKKRSGDGYDNVIQRSPMSGKSISPITDRFQSNIDSKWEQSTIVSKTLGHNLENETKRGLNNIPLMFRASHSSIIQRSSSVFRDSGNRHVDAVTPKKNTLMTKKFKRTPRVVKMPRVTAEDV